MRGAIPLATEVRWTTLRSVGLQLPETAAVRSKLAAVPASSTGSRCDGPRSSPMGAARKDAGCARASRGCSRPRTAQQLLITIAQVNGKMLRTFRHLVQSNSPELDFDMLTTAYGHSAKQGPPTEVQTRTKQRLRISNIATALVCLNPDLAKSTMVAMWTS